MTPRRQVIVISTNAEEGDFFASEFLPHTTRIARAADRVYRFYRTQPFERDYAFTDLDGEPLIEMHAFDTMADADAWVTEDARQRQSILSAFGRIQ